MDNTFMTESIIANLYWLSELTLYEHTFRLGSVVVSPTLHVPIGSMSANNSPSHESTAPLVRFCLYLFLVLLDVLGPLSCLTRVGSWAVLWCPLGGLFFLNFEDVDSGGGLVVDPNGRKPSFTITPFPSLSRGVPHVAFHGKRLSLLDRGEISFLGGE